MMPALGNVSYEPGGNGYVNPGLVDPRPRYSDVTAHEIDEAVRQAIEQAYERARDVLIRNREVLEAGAAQLLDREVLDESHLKVLFAAVQRRAEAPLAAFSNRSRGSS
jgi:cell division protease FtsH